MLAAMALWPIAPTGLVSFFTLESKYPHGSNVAVDAECRLFATVEHGPPFHICKGNAK
jgi:hypothetical protein